MVASSRCWATTRSQYSGATVRGPKTPTLPQFAAKFDPARRSPRSAASAAPGSARQRVRTMPASPKNRSGSGTPRKVPNATRQIRSASSRSPAASRRPAMSSVPGHAAVDGQRDAGDVGRGGAGEEDDHGIDLVLLAHAPEGGGVRDELVQLVP